jgi:hypothetical protein
MKYFVLDGHNPVACQDVFEWAKKFDAADRQVARTELIGAEVSTVFLGVDHGYRDDQTRPILFETLVFGGRMDGDGERYSTWAEAEAGHARIVERVRWADWFGIRPLLVLGWQWLKGGKKE